MRVFILSFCISVLVLALACDSRRPAPIDPAGDVSSDVGAPDSQNADAADGSAPLTLPEGTAFLLELTKINEPALVGAFLDTKDIPPVFLFIKGLTDGQADQLTVLGGIGELIDLGADDVAGTPDDGYGLLTTSIDPQTNDYLIRLAGSVNALALTTETSVISLDLSGVSSLTKGIVLKVSNATISGTFSPDLQRLIKGKIIGELLVEDIKEMIKNVDLNVPLTDEQIIKILDADGNGVIEADFDITGRTATVLGFVEPRKDLKPEKREPGTCCPPALKVGDPIDSVLLVQDQGIQPDEEQLAMQMVEELLIDSQVAMVVTMRVKADGKHYYVYAMPEIDGVPTRSELEFVRVRAQGKTTYSVVSLTGQNVLTRFGEPDDEAVLKKFAHFDEFALVGTNPNAVTIPDIGYNDAADPRLSFIEPSEMTYPHAYERLSQLFDDPRSGDLVVIPKPYAKQSRSTHGNLGSLQSRSPLVLLGAGIKTAQTFLPSDQSFEIKTLGDGSKALFYNKTARVVDIAPTIAAALGITKTTGVNPQGYLADDVYLKWQDGQVLASVFAQDPQQWTTPPAKYAIIIVNDGLTSMELIHEVLTGAFDVPGYRQLLNQGVIFNYGSITNFPSNTYPSHNTLGSGAYSGHHGIVDNHFYERELLIDLHPISAVAKTSYLLGSAHANLPVETLHEAVHRSFGPYDKAQKSGALTISINDPSSRGADFATLEADTNAVTLALTTQTSVDKITIAGKSYDLPKVDDLDVAGAADNLTMRYLAEIYQSSSLAVPTYLIVNFLTTDVGGHSYGPHGDLERHKHIKETGARLKLFYQLLQSICVPKGDPNCKPLLDQTLIALTSDHGMSLQDPSRNKTSTSARLRAAKFGFVDQSFFIYIKTLSLTLSTETFKKGVPTTVELTVLDGDSQHIGKSLPLKGATVSVVGGDPGLKVVTDDEGKATLLITPTATSVEFTVTLRDYNPFSRSYVVE